MSLPLLSLILFAGSIAAGLLGALTGLGGGIIIVPMLVLGFGIDRNYAIAASLVSIIATSSGSAAAYVREGYTNIRIGTLLGIASALGSLGAAILAGSISTSAVYIIFGVAVLYSSLATLRPPKPSKGDTNPDALAARLHLSSTYPGDADRGEGAPIPYTAHNVPAGFAVMILGGGLAGLVGIGGGAVKVLAMDRIMRLPFKVSTTTSNFMIGVTAAAGAGVYFSRGQVEPTLCFPIILGTTAGSLLGARLLPRIKTRTLRLGFAIVIGIIGIQMMVRGLTGPR